MDWFNDVLGLCSSSREFHLLLTGLGALASLVSITVGIRALWRSWFGPPSRHRRAAKLLRIEGHHHARLNHHERAMELYELSAQLNPKAGEVFYLRGLLREAMGDFSGAVQDWKRCLERLPRHEAALAKLERAGVGANPGSLIPNWGYAFGALTAVLIVALAGLLMR
jgi:tetratricopeptide (TPR) repeat protein